MLTFSWLNSVHLNISLGLPVWDCPRYKYHHGVWGGWYEGAWGRVCVCFKKGLSKHWILTQKSSIHIPLPWCQLLPRTSAHNKGHRVPHTFLKKRQSKRHTSIALSFSISSTGIYPMLPNMIIYKSYQQFKRKIKEALSQNSKIHARILNKLVLNSFSNLIGVSVE